MGPDRLRRGLKKHRASFLLQSQIAYRSGESVSVSGLLFVRHGTGIALATTRRTILTFATGMSILTTPLLLATGHVFVARFATVLQIATRFRALVGVLSRVKRQSGCGNSQARAHGDRHYECLNFSHFVSPDRKNCVRNSEKRQSDSERTIT
jgi:hypothetical protein